jgi:ketosteroid isomerase-like protein
MHAFRQAIENRDIDALHDLFAEDMVFRSPVVHSPYRGREEVVALLRVVAEVLEDFRYTREIGAPDASDHALVFRARVGDREVEGCDFIHVGDDGLVDELYVMFRPLTGVIAMAEAMGKRLATQG